MQGGSCDRDKLSFLPATLQGQAVQCLTMATHNADVTYVASDDLSSPLCELQASTVTSDGPCFLLNVLPILS